MYFEFGCRDFRENINPEAFCVKFVSYIILREFVYTTKMSINAVKSMLCGCYLFFIYSVSTADERLINGRGGHIRTQAEKPIKHGFLKKKERSHIDRKGLFCVRFCVKLCQKTVKR